jgi:choline dehydrogenase
MLHNDSAPKYDFVVCGSGSSGSVIARRLAENSAVSVLLIEAGGTDDVPAVMDPAQWPLNLGSERDWNFMAQPDGNVNGRSIPLNMGKVLGGGSSINVMAWARGHSSDWDYFAAEAGDESWSYRAVLDVYRRIEDWHGQSDTYYRGTGGPAFVQPAPDPNPIHPAVVAAAGALGIPIYASHNGTMMEREGGASILDVRVRNGRRQSVYRSYTHPYAARPNLTILTGALVSKVIIRGRRAVGVQLVHGGSVHSITADREVVLSLGAINTPKVLMQSGIGDASELRSFGIPVVAHLPGVGRNYQDHPRINCVWEYRQPLTPRNNASGATVFWKSVADLPAPDLQLCVADYPLSSHESAAVYGLPDHGWTLCAGVVRPKSRGQIRITGPDPSDPVVIEANMFDHPDDMRIAVAAVELAREIGNSAALDRYTRREVQPGDLKGRKLHDFIRNDASSYWHQTCTARMGRDDMSVVDSRLKVHGLDGLRVADGSIMPRITTGNTMAPCIVIGERASDMIKAEHAL